MRSLSLLGLLAALTLLSLPVQAAPPRQAHSRQGMRHYGHHRLHHGRRRTPHQAGTGGAKAPVRAGHSVSKAAAKPPPVMVYPDKRQTAPAGGARPPAPKSSHNMPPN